MTTLDNIPDSAYGQHPAWDDDLDFEDMSHSHYKHLQNKFDTPEMDQERHDHSIDRDENSEYNWGPPPPEHHLEPSEPPEVDDWPDPDHGREDHRVGAILRQSEQWPFRAARGKTESELTGKPKVVRNDQIKRLPGSETGLYGEDEDHPYDVYAQPNPKGDGWDVVRPLG